jgi:hypothetical protein
VSFLAPTTPGTYQVRFFENGGFTRVATSAEITVAWPTVPTLTVSSTTVNPGNTITVTLANGPGYPQDWVSFGLVSAPDGIYVAWSYLNGLTSIPPTGLINATLQFTAPPTPGTYEMRFFVNGGWTRLATSSTITVQ